MTEIAGVTSVACACCGEPRAEPEVARLACHPEIAVCAGCVDWMAVRVQARPKITPIFPVRDMTEAREFWTRTGVEVRLHDAGYAFLLVDGAEVDPSGNLLRIGANSADPTPEGPAALDTEDPLAVAVVAAIHTGDVPALRALLAENPTLAGRRIGDDDPGGMSRTLLHVVTDWPGHFPNGAEVVRVLVEAGADVDARFRGPHEETPLHWAASSDDVAVLDALLDLGADIEAPGAVIAGGAPLADARAFGNWAAALRLVERGARTTLTDAATLGLIDRVEAAFGATPGPTREEIDRAFWGACHGGRRDCAEYLLGRGANVSWIPDWEPLTPLDAAVRREAGDLVAWLRERGGKAAGELDRPI